jgi:CubicO group peptidase (beta-lactamase class C family)
MHDESDLAEATGRVGNVLEAARRAGRFPAAITCVSTESVSRPIEVSVGIPDITNPAQPTTPDVVWDLASLTKPLAITTLALLAQQAGKLDLNAPLADVLPEAEDRPLGACAVRNLLTHTSGLPAWEPVYSLARGRVEDALHILLAIDLVAPPQSRVEYSCLGFLVLGMVLERLWATSLDRLFRDQVAGPLDIASGLGYTARWADPERVAGGSSRPTIENALVIQHGGEPSSVPPVDRLLCDDGNARFLGGVAGNAGLFGTARAVARLASEYLPGGGSLMSPTDAQRATACLTCGLDQARGLGWQLAATSGCSAGSGMPPEAFGHTGFTGVSVWCDPVRRMVMVLLANRHHPLHRGVDLHPVRRRFHALATGP